MADNSGQNWLDHLRPVGRSRHLLGEGVYQALLEAILQGKVRSGQHLVEQSLANQFRVSRISVREAIRELANDGLVELVPNRGAFVVRFGVADLEEIFTLRASLEALAIGLATQRARRTHLARLEELIEEMHQVEDTDDRLVAASVDTRFHRALMAASGHVRAQQAWEQMSAQITMVVYNTSTYYPAIGKLAQRHQVLLDAIRAGNAPQAQQAVTDHIMVGHQHLVEALLQDPHEIQPILHPGKEFS